MDAFTKVVRLGKATDGNVYCEVTWDGKRLSIHGVVGPYSNGDCRGGAGQIIGQEVSEPAPGWTADTIAEFYRTWDRWHLNDMRAGCEHQRATWDTLRKLDLTEYSWTTKFNDQRRKAEDGELTAEEYANWRTLVKRVHAVTVEIDHPKTETAEVAALLAEGWIKPDNTETKAAGWVRPEEHPEGLLCKPCPICGYKYGSSWLYEDVPADVLQWLHDLPDTDKKPAWV